MIEEINMRKIVGILRKRILLILTIMLFSVGLAAVISYYLLTPTYQTSTQLLVNQEQSGTVQLTNQGIQTDLQLISTYSSVIKSPLILTKVIERLNLSTTVKELNEKITVNSSQDSQIIDILVEHESSRSAVSIANTTAEVFQSEIQGLMKVDNVQILWPAEETLNPAPIKPNPLLNMIAAAAIGLIIGIGTSFILAYMDMTIKDETDVEEILELPLLGVISQFAEQKPEKEPVSTTIKEKGVYRI